MTILLAVLLVILIFFISPFVSFGLGWLVGWFIKITIGSLIVKGFNLVGIHIPIESLPLFFGVLNVIASFFKTLPESPLFERFKKE